MDAQHANPTEPEKRYRLTCQFRPDGPLTSGWWTKRETAELRYREWVGLYGSAPETVITLTRLTDDRDEVLRVWPPQARPGTEPPDT